MYSFGPDQSGDMHGMQGGQGQGQQQRRTVSGQMIQRAVARQQTQNQLHMLPIEQGAGNQMAETEGEGGRTKLRSRWRQTW